MELLPHPLRVFEAVTGSGHYHLSLRLEEGEPIARGMDRLLEDVLGVLPRGGRVLDVGVGPGGSLSILSRAGFRSVGVDPDPRVVAYAAARAPHGAEVRCGTLQDVYDGPYDAILLTEVLQHHPDLDELLDACRSRLSRRGVVVVNDLVLCVEASWQAAPYHGVGALVAAGRRAGFLVLELADLTAEVVATFPRLGTLLRARRAALTAKSLEPKGTAAEVDELATHVAELGRAFEMGYLRYERTVLRAS